ncbi:MAG: hypothetical protein L6R37_006853 [Teloschistes peruensis]|nr:MAG: hypothetical protein L6R37_006853 [Teloschistes peruensis]
MSGSKAPAGESKPAQNMLWGGRFTGGLDPLMEAYNESLSYDKAFYAHDIAGSIAWARANKNVGILTEKEFNEIERGFSIVKKEWDTDSFLIKPGVDEDIHTANERRLGEVIGQSIAGKLHTGRSRNDQIATDLRLWLRHQLQTLQTHLTSLLRIIISRASTETSFLMPGYTHLQRAQPVRWSHFLLSYGFFFAADHQRLANVLKDLNRCPLGAGALSGNVFNVDREAIARELGFDGICWNSMNAVSDRDSLLETMAWGSRFMGHVSRLSTDLILYSAQEFNFVRLADAYSTGSSLMPQKKNPDALELLRGKSGQMHGILAGFTATMNAIPSCYNKDMQEGTQAILQTCHLLSTSTQILTGVLSTLSLLPEKMSAALEPNMLATELADHLVRRGVPFRVTHHIAGRVVALAEQRGVRMDELSLEELRGVDVRFGDEVVEECFDHGRAVEKRSGGKAKGGTGLAGVEEQVGVLKRFLDKGVMPAWGMEG